jgi:hypothetical protein
MRFPPQPSRATLRASPNEFKNDIELARAFL